MDGQPLKEYCAQPESAQSKLGATVRPDRNFYISDHKSAALRAYVEALQIFLLTLHPHDFFAEICE